MHCAIWRKISSGMYNPAQAGNTPTIRKKYDGGSCYICLERKVTEDKSQRGSKEQMR